MVKNLLVVLIVFLVLINGQNTIRMRSRHTATLINNKLYILGGSDSVNVMTNEFLGLDFSSNLNTMNLSWINLTFHDTPPPHSSATAVIGGKNNDTLFLLGGIGGKNGSFYTFVSGNSTWGATYQIDDFGDKAGLFGINSLEKIFLFGGGNAKDGITVVDLVLFSSSTIKTLSRTSLLVSFLPYGAIYYGAVLLPSNQNIIYIGGFYPFGAAIPLKYVFIYDTIHNRWNMKKTSGNVPSSRGAFSVVFDGQRIILFGGASNSSTDLALPDLLYELNLINFEWYIPKTSGQVPNSRSYHKANLVGNFMVISFGIGYNQSNESDILLLDISNGKEYRWTNDFIILDNNFSNRIVLFIVVYSFAAILLSINCLFLCKLYEHNKEKLE